MLLLRKGGGSEIEGKGQRKLPICTVNIFLKKKMN